MNVNNIVEKISKGIFSEIHVIKAPAIRGTGEIIKATTTQERIDIIENFFLNKFNDKTTIDNIVKKSGEVLVPKTLHADESGYFAMFINSEGNRLESLVLC